MQLLPFTENDTLLIGAALFAAALAGIVVSLFTDFLMTYYTASDEVAHANNTDNDHTNTHADDAGAHTSRRRATR